MGLLDRGGRETDGSHGYASVVVQFANSSQSACTLRGTPKVAILRADGTRLPVRYKVDRNAISQPVRLPSGAKWSASMTLVWSNWCRRKPGPLSVKVRLPHGGVVTGSLDGPPGFDFVPGCLNRQQPSELVLLEAYDKIA
jgi:hypothetical protein